MHGRTSTNPAGFPRGPIVAVALAAAVIGLGARSWNLAETAGVRSPGTRPVQARPTGTLSNSVKATAAHIRADGLREDHDPERPPFDLREEVFAGSGGAVPRLVRGAIEDPRPPWSRPLNDRPWSTRPHTDAEWRRAEQDIAMSRELGPTWVVLKEPLPRIRVPRESEAEDPACLRFAPSSHSLVPRPTPLTTHYSRPWPVDKIRGGTTRW